MMEHDALPHSVTQMQAQGIAHLSGPELRERTCGKCFVGLYRPPFHYVMQMSEGGTLWGRNNYGTEDSGHWSIDPDTGGLTVAWHGPWDAHTTHGYAVGQAIHFFDVETGDWRTSFEREVSAQDIQLD